MPAVHPAEPTRLFYAIPDAQVALGLSRATIYRLFRDRRLRHVKCGGKTLIPADSLREFVDSLLASSV